MSSRHWARIKSLIFIAAKVRTTNLTFFCFRPWRSIPRQRPWKNWSTNILLEKSWIPLGLLNPLQLLSKRARASTAYPSALNYFMAGISLLPSGSWTRRHELAFALEVYRAECEFLTGELAAAEERLTMLSARAANTVERANVECLRIDLYPNLDQADRAVAVFLDYLRHLRIE